MVGALAMVASAAPAQAAAIPGLPCAAGSSQGCSSFWVAACFAQGDGQHRFAGRAV